MNHPARKKANPQRLERFVSTALRKAGVPLGDADLTAGILIDADLRGIDSHGVMNLYGTYVKKLLTGGINSKPNLKLAFGSPTTASLDGDNGLGFVASHKAMTACIEMAKQHGTGWATVYHSNHSGAGAFYVLMAARQNMIGIHWSTGGSTVAGPGGKRRLIGNNVFAIAAPGKKQGPFVLDMAATMAIFRSCSWKSGTPRKASACRKVGPSIRTGSPSPIPRHTLQPKAPSCRWEARPRTVCTRGSGCCS